MCNILGNRIINELESWAKFNNQNIMRSTDKLLNCEHCRNYEFIFSQLQLLKRQIGKKNDRICQLELFIARISKMALDSETGSNIGSDINNPMELTFKHNQQQQLTSYRRSEQSVARFRSISQLYATESEPYQQGSINHVGSLSSLHGAHSKRINESTNYY